MPIRSGIYSHINKFVMTTCNMYKEMPRVTLFIASRLMLLLNGLTCALLELWFECTDHVAVIKVGSLFSVHRSGILLVRLQWLWRLRHHPLHKGLPWDYSEDHAVKPFLMFLDKHMLVSLGDSKYVPRSTEHRESSPRQWVSNVAVTILATLQQNTGILRFNGT